VPSSEGVLDAGRRVLRGGSFLVPRSSFLVPRSSFLRRSSVPATATAIYRTTVSASAVSVWPELATQPH